METPTLDVKPEVAFAYELLRELADGRIRIPGFHRPYVWRRDQMLDLLESVYRQYPIGGLLLWEISEPYKTLDWVGPIRIPKEQKTSVALVLDGQQRLSTLAGVLLPTGGSESSPWDDDPGRWEIWFNANESIFEHPTKGAILRPWHFPMRKLMDTIAYLKECQRIMGEGREQSSAWIGRIQHLAQVFQGYKVPVTRIKNTRLEQAVEIFARLNSKGQRVSADQMVSALVYTESGDTVFDLERHIDGLHGDLLKRDFGDMDRTTILRVILACLGEDVYRTDWTRIVRERGRDIASRFENEGARIREALAKAVTFLQGCGVYHERLLPYAMQLVVLTAFFYHCSKPSDSQVSFVKRWFWVSSFTGWGGGGNSSRIGGLVKEFSTTVAQAKEPLALENMRLDEPALPFPKRFDMRSARVRTLLLVLLAQNPTEPTGKRIHEPWKRVSDYGPEAIGRVVYLGVSLLVSNPANRIIKPEVDGTPYKNAHAKEWLLGLRPDVRETVLKSHAIPDDAYEALRKGDPEGFVLRRQQYLIDLELKFMGREGVALPSEASIPQPPPIDTDDVPPPYELFGEPTFPEMD